MSPRWLYWPAAAAGPTWIELATCTGWNIPGGGIVRNANGWSDSIGENSTDMWIQDTATAGVVYFSSSADRISYLSTYGSYTKLRVTDSSANIYLMEDVAYTHQNSNYVFLNGTWSGSLPNNEVSTIEIAL